MTPDQIKKILKETIKPLYSRIKDLEESNTFLLKEYINKSNKNLSTVRTIPFVHKKDRTNIDNINKEKNNLRENFLKSQQQIQITNNPIFNSLINESMNSTENVNNKFSIIDEDKTIPDIFNLHNKDYSEIMKKVL